MSVLELAFINNMIGSIPDDLKIKVSFDDSIVVDDDKRDEDMRNDVMEGIVPAWRYIVKKYKIDEKEAKAWIKDAKNEDDMSALLGIEERDVDEPQES